MSDIDDDNLNVGENVLTDDINDNLPSEVVLKGLMGQEEVRTLKVLN